MPKPLKNVLLVANLWEPEGVWNPFWSFRGLWCAIHRAASGEQPCGHMGYLGVGHAGNDWMSSVSRVSGFLWKLFGYTGISSQAGSLGLQEHQSAFLSRGDRTVCRLFIHCLALSICHNCLSTCPGERP